MTRTPLLMILAIGACGDVSEEALSPESQDRSRAQVDAGDAVDTGPHPDAGSRTDDAGADPDAGTITADAGAEQDASTDPAPTFDRIYDEILVPMGCGNAYCHGSGAGYLMLGDADLSYASLVGTRAFNGLCEVELRVAPGDPEASLLWRKIAPDVEVCESKMPFGTEGLSADQAELIRRWIAAGAPR